MMKFLTSFLLLFSYSPLQSAPLGTIPDIIEGRTQAELELQTDVWTSPYESKMTPLRRYAGSINSPVLNDQKWTASASGRIEGLSLSRTDIAVGQDDIPIGANLLYQTIGLGITYQNSDRSWSQIFAHYESSSDDPYANSRDTTPVILALHAFKKQSQHQWVVGVDYSKNRGYLNGKALPVLGVIYDFSEHLELIVGFPYLQAIYSRNPLWQSSVKITPVMLDAEVDRRINTIMWLGLKAGAYARSYMHTERTFDENRLYFHEKFISTTLRTELSKQTVYVINFGYSFGRKVYEAKEVFDHHAEHYRFNSDLFISTSLEFLL